MAANRGEQDRRNKQQELTTSSDSNRGGCPTPDLLKRVAFKSLPFDHPVVQHVGLCDFCLQDVDRLRENWRRRRVASIAAIFIGVSVISLGLFRSWFWHSADSQPATEMAVDLRGFAPERSDSVKAQAGVPLIPRRNLRLSFVLPIGLEPGQYEIRLMDEQLHIIREASGNALLQNYDIHLLTNLNLTSLSPGDYRLWIRLKGRSWRDYPLRIRDPSK